MKKNIYILFIFISSLGIAQDDDIVENHLGLVVQATTVSDSFGLGVGIAASGNFGASNFGTNISVIYLEPSEVSSDFIKYALQGDVAFKYDVQVSNGIELYPTLGGGYIITNYEDSNLDSNTDYYFSIGGGVNFHLGRTIIGLDIYKPFLEGSNVIIAPSVRFLL